MYQKARHRGSGGGRGYSDDPLVSWTLRYLVFFPTQEFNFFFRQKKADVETPPSSAESFSRHFRRQRLRDPDGDEDGDNNR